jgi:ketosteroid isomerase-like protein
MATKQSTQYAADSRPQERYQDGGGTRELVSRFYESFDRGDVDAALAVFSDDLETTDPGMGTVHGLPPFREYLETLKRAVPDARALVEQMYAAGDAIIVEGRFVGTHTGPLAGPNGDIEPTGASVDLRFADVSRVRDGKVVSYHTYYDQLGLLTQLGV